MLHRHDLADLCRLEGVKNHAAKVSWPMASVEMVPPIGPSSYDLVLGSRTSLTDNLNVWRRHWDRDLIGDIMQFVRSDHLLKLFLNDARRPGAH